MDLKTEKGLPLPPVEVTEAPPSYTASTSGESYSASPSAPSSVVAAEPLAPASVDLKSTVPSADAAASHPHNDSHKSQENRLGGVAILGGTTMDLTQTLFVRGEPVVVSAVSLLGSIDITVPSNVEVVQQGISILGDFTTKRNPANTGDIVATIRIVGVAILGSVTIKFSDQPARFK
ncbi:uncharacterized protein BJ171DRAFT_5900 [Polychytrium aggregatum]|uniref:uncharacterized protein n=1 Tax=Polychytrium aggregatum TaxID=110093 RepID=UPI0022FEE07F|nr:uncharacterized protein BJ171DRAFT_5900 [Polychytrium aggregatum]KAI9209692.1 hypothetical protein BJ171DRAFT_5900 [Polychytrium aggregatum]